MLRDIAFPVTDILPTTKKEKPVNLAKPASDSRELRSKVLRILK
jgi:hypothetical protein